MIVVDADYWSGQLAELSDAVLDLSSQGDVSRSPIGAGLASATSERLTLSVEEAAIALGISRASAYEAVHRGEIPHIKIGRRMLIPRASLDRMLSAADHPEDRA
jgi:excisionase family DNA binding protein